MDEASKTDWHACAGGVVLDPAGRVLLIQQSFPSGERQCTLPKGHLEAGEVEPQAAAREIREETGIEVGEAVARLPRIAYRFGKPQKRRRKVVAWFLYRLEASVEPEAGSLDEGVESAWWEPLDSAVERVTHGATRRIIAAAARVADRG